MGLSERAEFIAGPRVYVLGAQALNAPGLRAFLADEGFPEWETEATFPGEILPEVAGRVCYMSFAGGRGHREYVENIKRDRHGSVLEHATITFCVTGVSRTFTHELVRHRVGWSYSQLSQRYVDESHAQVVCPAAVLACRSDPAWSHVYNEWVRAATAARHAYRFVAGELAHKHNAGKLPVKLATAVRKLARGAARSLLPGATETKVVCTCNARSLRHFLEMRAQPAADLEIRQVALAMYRAARPFWPDLLGDYEVRTDDDGVEYLFTEYVKV